jgi:DNA-binding NtrC family response regulator
MILHAGIYYPEGYTLAKTKGNREKSAKILGIGERTLYRKIKEYNL